MTKEERALYYAGRLQPLIRCETVSVTGVRQSEKFEHFHALLRESFPRLFSLLTVEDFAGSLLMRWPGKSEESPILLMSHHDVVEAPGAWTHPPFSGEIADGKLWGRGTLDTKGNLFVMLQAAEELAEEGFVPPHDVWFVSTCTEETDGTGADSITQELQRRGLRFRMTLDEGGMMMYDPLGGSHGTFAMIGVGEKGCADLKFIARSGGGHASTPGKNTPLVRLGKFMAEADKAKCFTISLSPVVEEMFRRMAPTASGAMKLALSHVHPLRGILARVLPSLSPTAGAMLRTTLAFTMAGGSEGTNVLPQEAYVIGNMRFSHHQGQQDSFRQITALAEKYGIETEVLDPGFASHVTDWHCDGFRLTEEAVRKVFPGVEPAPYIMTGASDSRFFSRVSDCCLRFAPFLIDEQQLESIHGIDENIDIAALPGAVDFYRYIIKEN